MKLVRNKIPEIIREDDKDPITHKADKEEYQNLLNNKLLEEVGEYLDTEEVEELADVQEVIRAILDHKGTSFEELEGIRKDKKRDRGGFDEGIILEETE